MRRQDRLELAGRRCLFAGGSVGGLVARGLAGGYRQRYLGVRDQLIGITILTVLYFLEKHKKDVDMDEAIALANSHSN